MLISATGLIDTNPELTEAGIRRALAGNLCLCTGYAKIVAAIERAEQDARNVTQPSTFGSLFTDAGPT